MSIGSTGQRRGSATGDLQRRVVQGLGKMSMANLANAAAGELVDVLDFSPPAATKYVVHGVKVELTCHYADSAAREASTQGAVSWALTFKDTATGDAEENLNPLAAAPPNKETHEIADQDNHLDSGYGMVKPITVGAVNDNTGTVSIPYRYVQWNYFDEPIDIFDQDDVTLVVQHQMNGTGNFEDTADFLARAAVTVEYELVRM